MKIPIRGLLTAVLELSLCLSFAQSKQLKIGDQLPDLVLNNVLNYTASKLNLSDFKGKNIIIDFWNHKCVPCVKAFPLIDSLQRIHKNDLQFILVNKESSDSTKRFFKQRKNIKMPSVPLITADKLISSIFPHDGYPYSVWVDRTGIIRNFSGGYNTTAAHVSDFISGRQIDLFDRTTKPTKYGVIKDTSNSDFKFEFYSALTHCNRRLSVGSGQKQMIDSGRLMRMSLNCNSILNLIKAAYGEFGQYGFQAAYTLDVKVKDPYKLDIPKSRNLYDHWMESNSYSYEQWLPATRMDERFTIMQEDLKRYFNLDIRIEKRKVKSVVLSTTDNKKIKVTSTKGTEQIDDLLKLKYGDSSLSNYRFMNCSFDKLANYIQSWFIYQYPFFNECYYKGNIDIVFKRETLTPLNFQSLQEKLKTAGMDLRFEEREISVLVVRDK